MDAHTFRVIEYDKVLEMAAAYALTAPGRDIVQKTKPFQNIDDTRQQIALVSECRGLLSEGQHLGIEHFENLLPLFQRLRPLDAVLEPLELRSFLPLFYSALNLKMLSNHPSCKRLGMIVSRLTTHPFIKKAIEASIDNEGKLFDEASPELSSIRACIRSSESKIKRILEDMLRQKETMPYLQDFYLAERNNRWVIPVKRDFKGIFPGVIHDISNTGETVYMEPYAIQQFGNELETYRAEEKLEVYRILKRLAAILREHLPEIKGDYNIVVRIDALQALALFSERMDMYPPEINENGYMNIIRGRHPLLWKTLKNERRENELVPLALEIGREQSCMVITGSNAGGKTVALKTIGVLTLMALAGMHIPAASGTTIPFLRKIFADIGDEQSIEQNLSTFSGHITRISEIIRQSGSQTMVIIDELGTGTDPEHGSALSCAILRKLQQRGALTLVSTHLGMLKVFAHSETGMINSSMEMEDVSVDGVKTYRPTYKLVIGEPGSSHTFEIAHSLGLDADVIREARGISTNEGGRIESLISELKHKTGELNGRLKETEKLKQDVESLRSHLEEDISQLKKMKQDTLIKAMLEAEEFVRKTRKEARQLIDSMKKAPRFEHKEVIKELDKKLKEIITIRKHISPEEIQPLKEAQEGQLVFVNMVRAHGIVLSVNRKSRRCRVVVEGKDIIVPINELSEPIRDATEHQTHSEAHKGLPSPPSGDIHLTGELNVIGQRVDPALSLVERYLNDASVGDIKQVKIIHGIGTGILSRAIRDYLKDHPLIEGFRKGNEDEGGEAVTVVVL